MLHQVDGIELLARAQHELRGCGGGQPSQPGHQGPTAVRRLRPQDLAELLGLRIADCGLRNGLRTMTFNPQSAIPNPKSENPHSPICNPKSEIRESAIRNPKSAICWIALAILAATLLVYLPAIRGGYIWDDNFYVSENRSLRSFDGLRRIWLDIRTNPQYYPLVHTSYWIEYHLWKMNPMGFHVVNVVLHALNALLLWAVLSRLRLPGALLAAVIFALHPVHVESAAWVTERKNVLSCLFYLLSLLAYMRFAGLDRPEEDVRLANAAAEKEEGGGADPTARPGKTYLAALVLYICALLSKTVTCSLPAAVIVLLWMRGKRLGWRNLLPLLPFFVVGAGMGLLTAWTEKHQVGARGQEWAFTLLDRCLIAGHVLWFYVWKLLAPLNLTFIYPRWNISAADPVQYLFPLAAAATLATLWLSRRAIGRKPLAAALFFALTLAPALGFFNVYPMRYSFVADHFQYLASIGPIALLAGLAALAGRRLSAGPRRTGQVLVVAVVALLALLTFLQARVYRNVETLWRDTIAKNPACWMALNNLANEVKEQGKIQEAMALYRRAIEVKPDYDQAHANLAGILVDLGDLDGAIAHCEASLRADPDYVVAHNNLGAALEKKGRLEEAIAHYRKALDISPGYTKARENLDNALTRRRRIEETLRGFAEKTAKDPADLAAWTEWGSLLFSLNRFDEAADRFGQALRVNPAHTAALSGLGMALFAQGQGRWEEALQQFRRAAESAPQDAQVHYLLAQMLDRVGQANEAIAAYEQTLRISPSHLGSHNDLGALLATQGRLEEAIGHFEEALRIDPQDKQAQHNLARARADLKTPSKSIQAPK